MTAKDGVSRAERITNAFLELPVSRRSLVIFGVMHLFVFCLFIVVAQFFYPATGELERYVSLEILNGHVPYRDFAFEYPPLALLSFLVPGLISRTPLGYNLAFAAEMLLFDAIAIGLMASLATRLKISVSNSLVVYTLLILAIGPLAISRYDLLPAMLVLTKDLLGNQWPRHDLVEMKMRYHESLRRELAFCINLQFPRAPNA